MKKEGGCQGRCRGVLNLRGAKRELVAEKRRNGMSGSANRDFLVLKPSIVWSICDEKKGSRGVGEDPVLSYF